MVWLRRIEPLVRPFFHLKFRLERGMTLGVRGLVTDEAGRVLLIQHTYVKGWHLPGGGVDRGEAAEAAVIRELVEEVGIVATSRPLLPRPKFVMMTIINAPAVAKKYEG